MCAGSNIVVEEFLDGEEASFFALLDRHTCLALASAQVCMSYQQSCLFSVCHVLESADIITAVLHLHEHTSSHIFMLSHTPQAWLLVVSLARPLCFSVTSWHTYEAAWQNALMHGRVTFATPVPFQCQSNLRFLTLARSELHPLCCCGAGPQGSG